MSEQNQEPQLHQHASIWEKMPTETLVAEQERISEHLSDLVSKSETIELIISERSE